MNIRGPWLLFVCLLHHPQSFPLAHSTTLVPPLPVPHSHATQQGSMHSLPAHLLQLAELEGRLGGKWKDENATWVNVTGLLGRNVRDWCNGAEHPEGRSYYNQFVMEIAGGIKAKPEHVRVLEVCNGDASVCLAREANCPPGARIDDHPLIPDEPNLQPPEPANDDDSWWAGLWLLMNGEGYTDGTAAADDGYAYILPHGEDAPSHGGQENEEGVAIASSLVTSRMQVVFAVPATFIDLLTRWLILDTRLVARAGLLLVEMAPSVATTTNESTAAICPWKATADADADGPWLWKALSGTLTPRLSGLNPKPQTPNPKPSLGGLAGDGSLPTDPYSRSQDPQVGVLASCPPGFRCSMRPEVRLAAPLCKAEVGRYSARRRWALVFPLWVLSAIATALMLLQISCRHVVRGCRALKRVLVPHSNSNGPESVRPYYGLVSWEEYCEAQAEVCAIKRRMSQEAIEEAAMVAAEEVETARPRTSVDYSAQDHLVVDHLLYELDMALDRYKDVNVGQEVNVSPQDVSPNRDRAQRLRMDAASSVCDSGDTGAATTRAQILRFRHYSRHNYVEKHGADGSAEARTPRDTEVFQRMSSCVTVDSVRAIVDETISRTNEAMSRNRSLRASQQVEPDVAADRAGAAHSGVGEEVGDGAGDGETGERGEGGEGSKGDAQS